MYAVTRVNLQPKWKCVESERTDILHCALFFPCPDTLIIRREYEKSRNGAVPRRAFDKNLTTGVSKVENNRLFENLCAELIIRSPCPRRNTYFSVADQTVKLN